MKFNPNSPYNAHGLNISNTICENPTGAIPYGE